MENILTLILLSVFAELFEAYTQRATTPLGILEKLYAYYKESIFFFFLMQPGFYILLYVVLQTGVLNAIMVFLLALKVFDMFYKMEMIKKIFIQREVPLETMEMLEWKIPPYFVLLGVFTYPPLLFYALT